ncbi:hypothetical protein SAMN05216371_8324 [Streptomyces sp. TLI_053]|uniref:SMODS domain-containing nucleotidyltransferase n=1 Tax=Streptomyces sp. TLI_053 TaxID=1855352 RepID=UPI00087D0477|nr:nucleotidyltransferase [Streptomyces sp. TLI_053]SDT83488.1 hypothetical protein SAMN05216371_8324 [Streptomyces sp. TLI_053]
MALSVDQGFTVFLDRLVPLQSQRDAAARHRAGIESSLRQAPFGVQRFREIGSSFGHGTGIRSYCDVDLLVSITASRPGSSDTALGWVRDALTHSFPSTEVVVRRPTVVVRFANGTETWEVLPAFRTSHDDPPVYDIPAAASGWMSSAPTAHLSYVNEINQRTGIAGGAKKLARLAKAWKYYNQVPVSSFYLEMRAAQHLAGERAFSPVWDICLLLEKLNTNQLAAMNDPQGLASPFHACSTDATRRDALSKVNTAAVRARKALNAHNADDPATAFYYLDLLFGGRFPAR